MLAHRAGKRHSGPVLKALLANLSVVSLAVVANFTLPILISRIAFALRVLGAFRPPTMLVPSSQSAVRIILVPSPKPFLSKFNLVRLSHSRVLMLGRTICGRECPPRLNTTSTLLDMLRLKPANGAAHPRTLATMPQSTSVLAQRTAPPGYLSRLTLQLPLLRTRVQLRSRATYQALASTRMASTAPTVDVTAPAAQ